MAESAGWGQDGRVATRSEADLLSAERALHAAQLAGDVAALDRLLDDRLVAIGPDGLDRPKTKA